MIKSVKNKFEMAGNIVIWSILGLTIGFFIVAAFIPQSSNTGTEPSYDYRQEATDQADQEYQDYKEEQWEEYQSEMESQQFERKMKENLPPEYR